MYLTEAKKVTATYSHDALWTKAKLFMSYAMDDEPARTFDERALWAALALELLGTAALARVPPLLIASPNEDEDGNNLLIASGLIWRRPVWLSECPDHQRTARPCVQAV